jgi:predicted lipoprotein with Yx(FWY)xxD motif
VTKTSTLAAALAAVVLGLGACGSDEPADDASPEVGATDDAPAGEAVLSTADSEFGEIVVDGEGMTVYVFDKDTAGSGESACADQCLADWPPVTADAETPAVDGVSGEVGTITRDDGRMQVTLEGLPLYTFAGDSASGDTAGHGVQDVWWVVTPDGAKATGAPSMQGY